MRLWALAVALACAVGAGSAAAEVVDANPAGFQVKETVDIAAPAGKVWAALGNIGAWWSSEHTWSKDAKNLRLDLEAGGCLCESLAGGAGAARHMLVIFAVPQKTAIMQGTLGPLMFSGTSGHLIWSLAEADGHTTLTQTYYVGGYFQGGLDKVAPAVDQVLTEQIGRLKSYVESEQDAPPAAAPPPAPAPKAPPTHKKK